MLIPWFYATLEVETSFNRDRLAEQISHALGITFEKDFGGYFEEANALVSRVFRMTLGLYESAEQLDDSTSRRFVLSLWNGFDDLSLEQHELIELDVGDFLAALLHKRTGLPFRALPPIIISQENPVYPKAVPSLQAALELDTSKSIAQVAARVGAALGITFDPTECVGARGPYTGWWYVRTADAFAHKVLLYAEKNPYTTPMPRRIVLDIHLLDLASLDLEMDRWNIIKLPVTDYLAAILQQETELPFHPLSSR